MGEFVEGAKGKVKEAAGALRDDDDLRREGEAQQDKADAEREVARKETEAARARAEAQVHEARERAHQDRLTDSAAGSVQRPWPSARGASVARRDPPHRRRRSEQSAARAGLGPGGASPPRPAVRPRPRPRGRGLRPRRRPPRTRSRWPPRPSGSATAATGWPSTTTCPASPARRPPVLLAHAAGVTSSIRLGSGGVMLPNHASLVVAEQFGMLEALHPGRIDLGIGRAPGTDRLTALALRRSRRRPGGRRLPRAAGRADRLLRRRLPRGPPVPRRSPPSPAWATGPPLWLLGLQRLQRPRRRAYWACRSRSPTTSRPANTEPALAAYRARSGPRTTCPRPT